MFTDLGVVNFFPVLGYAKRSMAVPEAGFFLF